MAWTPLPTDYTDAVWSGLKKYSQIDNPDGTISFRDMTVYTNKEKSFFGAKDANRMNRAMNELGENMDEIAHSAETAIEAADTATERATAASKSATSASESATLAAKDAERTAALLYDNAGGHNSIYRGKYLGNAVTAAQYTAISSGKFTDLYIGDYWTIAGINYRIASFDYYLNTGDNSIRNHHVVIVPDTCLYTHVMNDTNITTGGYIGSKMYKNGLTQAKTTIKAAFSGHVLKHRVYFTNAVANGRPSAGAWCDSEVDLMCEEMVYGCGIFRPTSDGSSVPANHRIEKSQLPLFMYDHSKAVVAGNTYWLRDVVSTSNFSILNGGGADSVGASHKGGVRPAFCIF